MPEPQVFKGEGVRVSSTPWGYGVKQADVVLAPATRDRVSGSMEGVLDPKV